MRNCDDNSKTGGILTGSTATGFPRMMLFFQPVDFLISDFFFFFNGPQSSLLSFKKNLEKSFHFLSLKMHSSPSSIHLRVRLFPAKTLKS